MIRVDIISNAELNIAALEVSTGIELKLTSGCNIVNYKARERMLSSRLMKKMVDYKASEDCFLASKLRLNLAASELR